MEDATAIDSCGVFSFGMHENVRNIWNFLKSYILLQENISIMAGMNAQERLETLVKYLHTNVRTLGEMIGYDRPQALYDVQKGKTRNISHSMCDKILTVFPMISRVWLLTGEGQMIDPNITQQVIIPEPEDDIKKVPLLKLTAIAGPLQAYYEEGVDESECEMIVAPTPAAEIAIPINGDSMEPRFPNGAIAYIRRINESSFIPWGHPLVLDTDNGVFIKVVMPDPENEGNILAESYNPRYPQMCIPKAAIHGMYRVVNVSKDFFTL